jgi:hypothetical protein
MSIYLLSREFDLINARVRFERLCKKGATVEITEKKPSRSLRQNSYLHLILGWFGLNYGETQDYVKQEFFKRTVNPDIFVYERVNHKTGEIREALRRSRELDTRQMSIAIERFRDWSSKEAGIYLPAPNEDKYLEQVMKDLEIYNNQLYV